MYLGIDIGSVSVKLALIDQNQNLVYEDYLRTDGDVVAATKKMLDKIKDRNAIGIGVTGSGREFIKTIIGADMSIDEITAHRTAITKLYPDVKTIFEIGGQDSKLIYLTKNSINFEMNNACAAGTGSFLDQQATRLKMSITEFYQQGLTTKKYHNIASKCTVFAESDMIHAQQSGKPINQIIRGIHKGMINNYFAQFCKGKKLQGKFLFEGATSENKLLVEEFRERLKQDKLIENDEELIIPRPYNKIIGAIGVAYICSKKKINNPRKIPQIEKFEFIESKECYACPNKCAAEITIIKLNNKLITLGRNCQQ